MMVYLMVDLRKCSPRLPKFGRPRGSAILGAPGFRKGCDCGTLAWPQWLVSAERYHKAKIIGEGGGRYENDEQALFIMVAARCPGFTD